MECVGVEALELSQAIRAIQQKLTIFFNLLRTRGINLWNKI